MPWPWGPGLGLDRSNVFTYGHYVLLLARVGRLSRPLGLFGFLPNRRLVTYTPDQNRIERKNNEKKNEQAYHLTCTLELDLSRYQYFETNY